MPHSLRFIFYFTHLLPTYFYIPSQKSGTEVRQSKESQAQTKEEKAYSEAKNKLFDRVKRTSDRYGASDEEKRTKPGTLHGGVWYVVLLYCLLHCAHHLARGVWHILPSLQE